MYFFSEERLIRNLIKPKSAKLSKFETLAYHSDAHILHDRHVYVIPEIKTRSEMIAMLKNVLHDSAPTSLLLYLIGWNSFKWEFEFVFVAELFRFPLHVIEVIENHLIIEPLLLAFQQQLQTAHIPAL